jgi:hypothetical protein
MTPWKDANYPTLDLREHRLYNSRLADRTVEYKNSPILFIGSCDVAGIKHGKYWHEIYAEKRQLVNYVKIGQAIQSFSGLMRTVYTYLSNVEEKPKSIYMVVPMTSAEHVIGNKCYSVNYQKLPVEHLHRLQIIPESSWSVFQKLHEAYNLSDCLEERIYNFGREFSFLEMMCKAYNIELKWTFNLTITSKFHFGDVNNFIDSHNFAKNTYIGTKETDAYDLVNYCPTYTAHKLLADLFMDSEK